MIRVKGVSKSFGTQVVLRDVNLTIESGQTLAVVGPSGTGKSVLLKIVTGLLSADAGEVTVGNYLISSSSSESERFHVTQQMGILFQGAALLDSITLYDNLAFPMRWKKKFGEKEIVKRCNHLMEEVGLAGLEELYPSEVPIGIRKRLGIARALACDPDIILFDEPNTGLDPETGQEIYDLIKAVQTRRKVTGIVISHEIPEVFQICQLVVMLYGGNVQTVGTVDEFLKNEDPVVRQFVSGSVDGPIALS